MRTKKRNPRISIAKGIAIILMVMGHALHLTPSGFEGFVNLFHMPLFFFTAGYCFNTDHYAYPSAFLRRRVKGILLPYFLWSVVFIVLHNPFISCGLIEGTNYSVSDVIFRVFKILTFQLYTEDLMGAYWFLPALFIAEVFAFTLLRLLEYKRGASGFLCLAAFALMSLAGKVLIHRIPYFWMFGNGMFAVVFFAAGHYFNRFEAVICKGRFHCAVILSFAAVVLLSGFAFWRTSLTSCSALNSPLYVLSAIGGILIVMFFSSILARTPFFLKLLTYIGDHTLSILTWHFLSFKIISCLLIMSGERGQLDEFPTIAILSPRWWWAYSIVGVFIPLLISMIYGYLICAIRERRRCA